MVHLKVEKRLFNAVFKPKNKYGNILPLKVLKINF